MPISRARIPADKPPITLTKGMSQMTPIKTATRFLLVSGNEASALTMSRLLRSQFDGDIRITGSGNEARQCAIGESYDVIVINSPLSDEFGSELALHLSEVTAAGIILIVPESSYSESGSRCDDFGAFTLSRPLGKENLLRTVRMCLAVNRRMNALAHEISRLSRLNDELKAVGRAKCLLIQNLRMSEEQAHRYIEKRAMDLRMTRIEVAEEIIRDNK